MCKILTENKQLKNLIASIDKLDMSPEDYQKYRPLLNRVLDEVSN